MELVAQEDGFGCGVACVASILGLSYQEALRLFPRPDRAKNIGFHCKDLKEILNNTGLQYAVKYAPKFRQEILNGTIVFTRKGHVYPGGHYLVKTPLGWMNPWINFAPPKAGWDDKLPGEAQFLIVPN